VTGITNNGTYLTVLGTSYAGGHVIEQYTYSGTHYTPWLSSLSGLGVSYDCGYSGGSVWIACNDATYPIKAFNASGIQVGSISGSLISNAARGVDFDSSGYLWVSNPNNDKIYKIGLGTSLERTTWADIKLME
jgi:hypothetical protein